MISEPFYFGRNNSCFGNYTPSTGLTLGKSVLVAPSIFGEAIRSHRVLREVTKNLSNRGYDVLRFDYDGDGNSCSDTANTSVQLCIENIQDARLELIKRSTGSHMSVLATRFGAGFAFSALKNTPVDSIVLWDPLLSKDEMYNSFIGSGPVKIEKETDFINPFESQSNISVSGFYDIGVGEDFAGGFLQLEEITLPDCKLQLVSTDTDINIDITSDRFNVKHQCDWQIKDLPVIFAPKIISTLCECF